MKSKNQKVTGDSKPVLFGLFTEEDEVLRLKCREKICDKKIEESSESLQQARENIALIGGKGTSM